MTPCTGTNTATVVTHFARSLHHYYSIVLCSVCVVYYVIEMYSTMWYSIVRYSRMQYNVALVRYGLV